MYDDILVPTDGSEPMADVIDRAVDLATQYDATVHALFVVNSDPLGTIDVEIREHAIDSLEKRGKSAVEAVTDAAEEAGVDSTTTVERGIPSKEIVEYAEDRGIDMIVMGTHGRTGLSHFLLGSVAEKVIRQASVPVFLVRMGGRKSEGQ